MGKWRDIATAPKDGTIIDLWYPEPIARRAANYQWDESEWFKGEWVHRSLNDVQTFPNIRPTHWMPLPEAPKP